MSRPTRPATGSVSDPTAAQSGRSRRALTLAFLAAAVAACGCCARPYQPYGSYGGVPPYYGGGQAVPQGGAYGQPAPSYAPQPIPGGVPQGGTYAPPSGGVPVLPAPDSNFGGAPGGFDNDGFGDSYGGSGTGGGPYYDDQGYGPAPADGALPPSDFNYTNPDAFDSSPSDNGVDNLGAPGGGAFDPPPGYQDPEPGSFDSAALAPQPGGAPAFDSPAPQAAPPARPASAGPRGFGAAPQHGLNDPFVKPAGHAAAPAAMPVGGEPIPTGYGPNYEWLRGMLEHEDGVWTITYALDPAPGDRFGGVMTLADPGGRLAGWENEKLIVRLKGRPDPAAGADFRGLPRYVVQTAEPRGVYE